MIRYTGGDSATLFFTNDSDPAPHSLDAGNVAGWTDGYARGTTTITVDRELPASLVGSLLHLDQVADGVEVVAGGANGSCGIYCTRDDDERMLQQTVLVTAIDGNTVTFSPGLYSHYWSAAHQPEVWWENPDDIVSWSGVEDLKIDGTDGNEVAIKFTGAYACWARNIDSFNVGHYNVFLWFSKNIEIRDCYLHQTSTSGSDVYALEIEHTSSDVLVIDNIVQGWSIALSIQGTSGDVFAYNYALDFPYDPSPGWMQEMAMTHGAHPHALLFEGNVWPNIWHDNIWGSSSHDTAYRNRLFGWAPGKDADLVPMVLEDHNHHITAAGNVLGSTEVPDQQMFGVDDAVADTFVRHGNHDVVRGTTEWDPSIASHALPPSLFLPGQPSWWSTPWGTPPWPAIGPDPEDPEGPPSDEKIPAQLCFEHLSGPSDADNHTYDARDCHGL